MIKLAIDRHAYVAKTGRFWLAGFFIFCAVFATAQPADLPAPNRCGTDQHEQVLQRRNPNRLRQILELNHQIEQAQKLSASLRQPADQTIYRIPVVVHVVHNTASGEIGGINNVNISDEQIRSQIEVLNEDYRRKPGTNGFNTDPIGADAGIEFYLATVDPNGQPTNGITRHYYAKQESFSINDDVLLSEIAYWPSDRYLNIWVVRLDEYLGYTQFPTQADTLSGLVPEKDSNEFTDGSLIDYRYFGRQIGTVRDQTYALGRTATHEIGHWLGLIHTWGDTECGDDYVADTPRTRAPNQTRQCRQTFSMCDGVNRTRDQIENYLDYSPDACMNLFTAGQVARMRTVLALSPRRAQLIRSAESPLTESDVLTLTVYPNPAASDPALEIRLKGFQSFTVDLFTVTGQQVRTTRYTDYPSTRLTLPVAGLSAGVYIVRVKTDTEVASKRLVIL